MIRFILIFHIRKVLNKISFFGFFYFGFDIYPLRRKGTKIAFFTLSLSSRKAYTHSLPLPRFGRVIVSGVMLSFLGHSSSVTCFTKKDIRAVSENLLSSASCQITSTTQDTTKQALTARNTIADKSSLRKTITGLL